VLEKPLQVVAESHVQVAMEALAYALKHRADMHAVVILSPPRFQYRAGQRSGTIYKWPNESKIVY
jgi:hypothetical protein